MSTHTGWKSIKNTGQDHHSSEVWLCHQGLKPERRVGLFCLLCTSCPLPLDSGTAWVIAINPTHAGIDPKHPPMHPLPVGLYLHYFSFGTSRSADGPLWIVCDAVPSWRSTLPSVSASTASRMCQCSWNTNRLVTATSRSHSKPWDLYPWQVLRLVFKASVISE